MNLAAIDWIVIGLYFAVVLLVGLLTSFLASRNSAEFFLGGRSMPWWLLGISMVATTFSADTPNLVTDIVRTDGVWGNWVWWAFLLTGMLTVFVYARLWRRCGVLTDLEFYEIRYSGKTAAFLRGFRGVYLGLLFNVLIMATVSLAAIKIGGVLLGFSPLKTILLAMLVTLIYSGLGGLRAVLVTDFILFAFALCGSVLAAVYAVRHPDVGGLSNLFAHPNVADKLRLIPVARTAGGWTLLESFVPVFVIPLAVQWWSAWYPGSEPGGGGYMAQRMLSAKDESGAVSATLLFNICHYAVRPWPWILVALASLVLFPDPASIAQKFPRLDPSIIGQDIAYPVMLTLLPPGIIGIAAASILAAYMSTMSTHLNWGASYMVHDLYHRFIRPQASEKELVMAGRLATLLLLVLAGLGAFLFSNALQAFHILLQIGAGTGLIFILRWFWWRINAWTEITGMTISFLFATYIELIHPRLGLDAWPVHLRLLAGVGLTTAAWLVVTFLTRPTDDQTLRTFCRLARPGGPGWKPVLRRAAEQGDPIDQAAPAGGIARGILCMLLASVMVYGLIFASGYCLYGRRLGAVVFAAVSGLSLILLLAVWKRRRPPAGLNAEQDN